MKHLSLAIASAWIGGVLFTVPAVAQMSRATFESLTMPMYPHNFPESRYQNVSFFWIDRTTTTWASNNTYGRVLTSDSSQSNNPDNVWYATIAAESNMYVTVAPYWDSPIAPAGPRPSDGVWADGCGHSHFGYAAFNRIWLFNGSQWTGYVTLRASEGRIGRRYEWVNGAWRITTARRSDLPCYVTSDPDPGGTLASFIWKNNIQNLDPVQFVYSQNGSTIIQLDEITVAMQGATHGAGNCGYFLCFPQVSFVAFRSR